MKRVAIIGAGLAGASVAYVLKQRGLEPVIYEAGDEIAPGASGNALGLYNPRLSAERTFYADAFELALQTFPRLKGIGWNQCGSLHLMTDEKKGKRFQDAVKNWGWDDMRIVNTREASDIAGVEINKSALWLPKSGIVSPKSLCMAYAKGIEINFNTQVRSTADIKADAVIVAGGMNVKNFVDLPLRAVRGQITFVEANTQSQNINCNLCYGGYMTPSINGTHAVGATFQRWLDHSQIIDKDDADNIEKLTKNLPSLAGDFEVTAQRAAVRTTTPDHMPIFGRFGDIYVSTGHGSHGIISALYAAHRIADDIAPAP
jgi:tRNA 5-methylaminomethyl-2-thiouridine biosynthesis bifunctional protein